MKYAGVGHRVEIAEVLAQVEDISHVEPDAHTARARLVAGLADRVRGSVDADDIQPARGEVDRVLSGAAADVEHASRNPACVRKRHELGLRLPDVPRRRTRQVHRLEALSHDHAPPGIANARGR